MTYGSKEFAYAEPFANALVNDPEFRTWVLRKTKFASFAADARLLDREMLAKRSKGAGSWWRSHFTEACRCHGCSGQETDLLAVFESPDRYRFALHVEVKHPGDGFKKLTQAPAYPARAQCWVQNPPKSVLRHSAASTALLCSRAKLSDYAEHLRHFEALIVLEDVEKFFPAATMKSLG